jgi:hypothetical protein
LSFDVSAIDDLLTQRLDFPRHNRPGSGVLARLLPRQKRHEYYLPTFFSGYGWCCYG